ncbi:hypothetical protein M5D96_003666, partial [Drosophila gunungcola]
MTFSRAVCKIVEIVSWALEIEKKKFRCHQREPSTPAVFCSLQPWRPRPQSRPSPPFACFTAGPLLQFVVRLTKCMAKQPTNQQLATATSTAATSATAAVQCMRLKLKLKFCTLHLKQQTANA